MSAYSIATRGLAGRKIPQGVLAPMNALLFGASEPGAWYDPSDLSTLFQDSAGTTPVTAVEQPVGRMLDKSGRGNHASQATSTKRPKYSRRVNLLTNTGLTGFVAGSPGIYPTGWYNDSVTGAIADDSGSIRFTTASNQRSIKYFFSGTVGATYRLNLNVFAYTTIAINQLIRVSGVTGVLTYEIDGVPAIGSDSLSVGAHVVSLILTISSVTTPVLVIGAGVNAAVTSDITVNYVSMTLATDAHLPYQWVNTATDYDADPAKFPGYLRFDGVDDALQTANIDFTGTDKMTVWAGITKLSDAGTGLLVELSATSNTNDGSFKILSPELPGPRISSSSRGTAVNAINQSAISGVLISPDSHAVSASHDIYASATTLRVDGVVVSTATGNKGTGNYGNYPLYIGARAGTSLFFNGRLYSLIARGAATPLPQIEAVETLIRQKMRLP